MNLIDLAKESLYLKKASNKSNFDYENYKLHFKKAEKFSFFINNFVEKNESIQLADSYIEKFSETKLLNDYKTTFEITSQLFESDGNDYKDIGLVKLAFEIVSPKGMRGIANRELFNFWVDEENREMLFMYHGQSSSEKAMNILHISFDSMMINLIGMKKNKDKVFSKMKM